MAVVGIEELARRPLDGGRDFGDHGPYEFVHVKVRHLVDPTNVANRTVADLGLVPGPVEFSHDLQLLRPAETTGRRLLVDVVNRGRPTASRFLNRDNTTTIATEAGPPPVGDGHLFEQGWVVALVGWQFDISHDALLGLRAPDAVDVDGAPFRGPVTYSVQPPKDLHRLSLGLPGHRPYAAVVDGMARLFERAPGAPEVELVDGWSLAEDGRCLERADGFVAGHRYRCTYETIGAPVVGLGMLAIRDVVPWARDELGIGTAVCFGASQCGRVIRQYLHDGLNTDESGVQAYDAVMPLIAGGRLGQFNQRFGNPGTLPMGAEGLDGAVTYDDLLASCGDDAPLVMAMNTSTEYWRGDAALVHGSTDSRVRVHHVAGTQHTAGIVPQMFEDPYFGTRGAHGFNTVDYRYVVRSLLAQLVEWAEGGAKAEPSCLPTDQELTTRESVQSAMSDHGLHMPDLESFGEPVGVVPSVRSDGNEVGAIRLPDLVEPLGIHTGWNLRHQEIGAPRDQLMLRGLTQWFDTAGLLGRYGDEAGYIAAVQPVIDELIARRLVLSSDRLLMCAEAGDRWLEATRPTSRE